MYVARSASDKTDDWPFWMVWDGHMNVTYKACKEVFGDDEPGAVFVDREWAETLAHEMNMRKAA